MHADYPGGFIARPQPFGRRHQALAGAGLATLLSLLLVSPGFAQPTVPGSGQASPKPPATAVSKAVAVPVKPARVQAPGDRQTQPPPVQTAVKTAPPKAVLPQLAAPPETAQAEDSPEQLTTEEKPLDAVYAENRARRGVLDSPTYLLRVFGLLALLMGLFYLGVRYLAPRWQTFTRQDPLIPFSPSHASRETAPAGAPGIADSVQEEPPKSWLSALFKTPLAKPKPLPVVLSRTRLGAGREVLVLEIAGKQLVVGVTPQQMSVLTELSPTSEDSREITLSKSLRAQGDEAVYRKYLTPPQARPPSVPEPPMASPEEITLLDDYDDQFDLP